MSMWGVIHDIDNDTGYIHIAPVTVDGLLMNSHICDGLSCWCQPLRDDLEPKLIVHNDPERGGYNA